jgi:hypothetical protein
MTLYDAEPQCHKCRKRIRVYFWYEGMVPTGQFGDKFTYDCPECGQKVTQAFESVGEHPPGSQPPTGATMAAPA